MAALAFRSARSQAASRLASALGAGPRVLFSSSAAAAAAAAVAEGSKLDLSAPATLQKARSWDDGVASQFATSSLADVFKGKKVLIFGVPGAFTGVCTKAHVPGYLKLLPELRAKGADAVVCTAVNDPYTLHAWAKQMGADDKVEFLADFDGSFHKLLGLDMDLSAALLGHRSQRWAAVVEDGVVKSLQVENSPGELELTTAEAMLEKL